MRVPSSPRPRNPAPLPHPLPLSVVSQQGVGRSLSRITLVKLPTYQQHKLREPSWTWESRAWCDIFARIRKLISRAKTCPFHHLLQTTNQRLSARWRRRLLVQRGPQKHDEKGAETPENEPTPATPGDNTPSSSSENAAPSPEVRGKSRGAAGRGNRRRQRKCAKNCSLMHTRDKLVRKCQTDCPQADLELPDRPSSLASYSMAIFFWFALAYRTASRFIAD